MPKPAASSEDGTRVTVTISAEQDRQLRALAAEHKVSMAWLVRRAVDRLLDQNSDDVQLALDLGKQR